MRLLKRLADTRAAARGPLRISELWVFPIKSCGGVRVDASEMDRGGLGDMVALGICESLQAWAGAQLISAQSRLNRGSISARLPPQVKEQVLLSSSEAAEMILRVDDIVQCAPRQRQQ